MEQIRFIEGGEEAIQELGTLGLQGAVSAEQAAVGEAGFALNGRSTCYRGRSAADLAVAKADTCPVPASETVPVRPGVNERNGQTLANVYIDPTRHTVSLLLDDRTANCVIYAVRALAAEYEAHAREVRLAGELMPPDSYGAVNRLRIAGRHERIATRLRVLERNYQSEVGGGWTPTSASDAI